MNVLGLNIRSLGFHHDQLKILLETFERKPEIVIITETWLTENDPLDRFELDENQPVESKPRECFERRSGGVAFYVKEGIRYRSVELQTQTECSIVQVNFSDGDVKNFCAVYRPETFRLDQKLKKLNETSDVNAQMKEISESIMACVDHFAPEKPRTGRNKSDDWITNTIKNAIRKRDDLFQLWIRNPTEWNCQTYRKCRNKVTEMIRSEKKNANFKKLGTNPTAKTIYKTLKSEKSNKMVRNYRT